MASSINLLFCLLLVHKVFAKLPGELKSCKQLSPDYSKCLSTEIERALDIFKNGDKKLGISSIDPMNFDKMVVNQGSGPVAIKLEFKNMKIFGMAGGKKVHETKNDWKTIQIKMTFDRLVIIGDYTISGKVLILPIAGTGKCNITLTDVDAVLILNVKEIHRGNKHYLQAEMFDTNILPKRTYFQLDNLFNGDKALGDNMNLFLNENHAEIVAELKPAISTGLSSGFGKISNQILAKVPLVEIKV